MPWAEFLEGVRLYRGADELRTLLAMAHSFSSYDKFCERMADAYAAGIVGTAHDDVVRAARTFVENDTRVFAFVQHLLSYFASTGLEVVVVTGGPDEPMQQYATTLGFSLAGTLQLEIRNGIYTGGILRNAGLCDKKQETVSSVVRGRTVVMAFGDSPADVPLWKAADVRGRFIVAGNAQVPSLQLNLVPIDPTTSGEDVVKLVSQRVVQDRHS